jgi:hypothetical protein
MFCQPPRLRCGLLLLYFGMRYPSIDCACVFCFVSTGSGGGAVVAVGIGRSSSPGPHGGRPFDDWRGGSAADRIHPVLLAVPPGPSADFGFGASAAAAAGDVRAARGVALGLSGGHWGTVRGAGNAHSQDKRERERERERETATRATTCPRRGVSGISHLSTPPPVTVRYEQVRLPRLDGLASDFELLARGGGRSGCFAASGVVAAHETAFADAAVQHNSRPPLSRMLGSTRTLF